MQTKNAEKTEIFPVQRAADKNAKYYTAIRIIQMEELEAEFPHL